MPRTAEQKAADEALSAAIDQARRAYGMDEDWLVTDWIILTAETRWDDEGDQVTSYSRLFREGSMADFRALGLLDVHATVLRGMFQPEGE